MVTIQKLVSMLQYMRPAYSTTEQVFCEKYLEPVFGKPDEDGNYIKVVGDLPRIAYTAHTDTVHRSEGIQKLHIADGMVKTVDGSCLGADCTTGLWLLLYMIDAGVEGVYIAHAAEEIGGIGSSRLVARSPLWLQDIDACISFDRYGTGSIITHQSGMRTASDDFASSLATALDLPLKGDPYGTYTDSMEYAYVVPECTNLSVGYYDQHSSKEAQDLSFVQMLAERLVAANWSTLVISRDPDCPEYPDRDAWLGMFDCHDPAQDEMEALERLVMDRPTQIAEILHEYGITLDYLQEELQISYCDMDYYMDGKLHNPSTVVI